MLFRRWGGRRAIVGRCIATGACFGAATLIACTDDERTATEAVRADSGTLVFPDAAVRDGSAPIDAAVIDAPVDSAPSDAGLADAADANAPCPPLALKAPLDSRGQLFDATLGQSYSVAFNAGGTPPLTYSIIAGTTPPGLTLDPTTGVFSGIPSGPAPFTYTFGVYVTDSCPLPQNADGTYNLDIVQ